MCLAARSVTGWVAFFASLISTFFLTCHRHNSNRLIVMTPKTRHTILFRFCTAARCGLYGAGFPTYVSQVADLALQLGNALLELVPLVPYELLLLVIAAPDRFVVKVILTTKRWHLRAIILPSQTQNHIVSSVMLVTLPQHPRPGLNPAARQCKVDK